MLILTRRVGESLIIDNDTTVTVLSVRGQQVRIGVDAPKDKVVDRSEIHEKKQSGESPSQPFDSSMDAPDVLDD